MLWRIAGFAALGGFLFGYDLGVMVRHFGIKSISLEENIYGCQL